MMDFTFIDQANLLQVARTSGSSSTSEEIDQNIRIRQLSAENEQLAREAREAHIALASLVEEFASCRRTLAELTKQCGDLGERVRKLDEQPAALFAEQFEAQRLDFMENRAQFSKLTAERDSLREQNQSLARENAKLSLQLASLLQKSSKNPSPKSSPQGVIFRSSSARSLYSLQGPDCGLSLEDPMEGDCDDEGEVSVPAPQ